MSAQPSPVGLARVLLVEDDAEMRHFLEDELQGAGYSVISAANGGEALQSFQRNEVDAVVTDLIMPTMKGDELLGRLRRIDAQLPIVIMTAFGSIESAVETIRGGAYHYITKPFRVRELLDALEAALREQRQLRELTNAALGTAAAHGIVAESAAMKRTLALVARAASADTPVLLRGESGTGKELIARALHANSPRRDGPFVAINCSAIPETLLESQLFGHRRGAFTDARQDQPGMFMSAEGGTLLLDEIGDMAPALQAKLLRVLQEGEVQPLGAPRPEPVNVRVIAATHRDLEALCGTGQFRQDLYYRLNVIMVHIPPLRDRLDDLVPLVGHFLEKHGRRLGRAQVTVSREAFAEMRRYEWPGNVRELENVIERALVLGHEPVIRPADLPERSPAAVASDNGEIRSISEMEREQIVRALRSLKGNKAAAARLLGLDRKTLYRKIELYGLQDLDS
jgi:two-component system response regulator HydG